MPHCTPEQLALAALREPLAADDAEHLAGCPRCRAEVRDLQRGVDLLAVPELATTGPPAVPPPSVWAGIAAATGVTAAPRPDRVAMAAGPAEEVAPPVPLRPRRPARARLLVAVAVAAAVGAGTALGAVALTRSGPAGTTVADARLQALGAGGASGSAVVVEHPDHSLELDVTLDRGRQPGSGYYEVWLADPGLARMVAVGVLQDGRGALPLPPGLSLRSYPVVDVSDEPLDGDPAHSADSVARGVLR